MVAGRFLNRLQASERPPLYKCTKCIRRQTRNQGALIDWALKDRRYSVMSSHARVIYGGSEEDIQAIPLVDKKALVVQF